MSRSLDHERRVRAALSLVVLALLAAPWRAANGQAPPARSATSMIYIDTIIMPAMAGPLGIPMARMGSGSSWLPEANTLPRHVLTAAGWSLMLHGAAFAQYDAQGGARGAHQFGGLNWGMLMASRAVGGGRLTLRGMFSLDALTVGDCGYPLIGQTGESCHGHPLVDRQHPHDAIMELDAEYERAVAPNLGFVAYAAPVGEPALGPVAFMHRPSAEHDPAAPLGHHWQDATHVTFGVLTAGLFSRVWRVEGSVFNGREPDENRWNIDPIRLDSYAARATVDPNARWSFTAGYGFIKSPEALLPGESVHRATASALFGSTVGADHRFAATAVYGGNWTAGEPAVSNSALIEADLSHDGGGAWFTRAEMVEKTAEELNIVGVGAASRFRLSSIGVGYAFDVMHGGGIAGSLGAMGTVNVVPSTLAATYGSRTPLGLMVFVRFTPLRAAGGATMDMDMPGMMGGEGDVRRPE